ncbi:MAG: alpha-2-macroglobulin, partial [Candidatus Azobacteroides sp.]|nr:alpha-2-macroglobulin [Candidatus Azobacteroides sp.]
VQSRWCLAAAYALDGKTKAAEELIFNIATTVQPYYWQYTYGSSDRDEAMILQTMVLMGRLDQAFKQAQQMAARLSQQSYFDTQSTAFALMAMGRLAEKLSGAIDFDWKLNGKSQPEVKSAKAGYQSQLPKQTEAGSLSLTNKGKGVLYVNVASKFRPLIDTLPEISNNLKLRVFYADLTGNKAVDMSELKQGTDFIAQIEVTNTNPLTDYTDIALTYIIPSGWEIFNERMTSAEGSVPSSTNYKYQDIRDDRVLTYFDLPRGSRTVIKVRLQASYIGSFTLPAVQCEAMYDTSAQAKTMAGMVKVVK